MPHIEWDRRLRLRRVAPLWLTLAVAVVLLTLAGANLAVRRSAAPAAVVPSQSTFDPVSLAIGAAIEDAERAGQVQPGVLSAALYATSTPTPSATPWPTRTPPPTPTLTPTPTETPAYVVSEARLPVVEWERVSAFTAPIPRAPAALLEPMAQVYQRDDPNEAPMVAAMLLSFYGIEPEQTLPAARRALPLDPDSRVALPGELVKHLAEYRLAARVYEGVTLEQMQRLITNGVPVIVAQWLTPEDTTPHYRIIRGYSDPRGVVLANDSEFAAGISFSYAEFAKMWEEFQGFAMPVFLPRQAAVVEAILGVEADKTAEYVDGGRKLGEPSREAMPGPPPATVIPAGPAALVAGVPSSGRLLGSGGGTFSARRVAASAREDLTVILTYTPDDPIIARGVGLRVLDATGYPLGEGVNVTGGVGERTLSFTAEPGREYLVQVYNYMPGVPVSYTILARGATTGPPATAAPAPDSEATPQVRPSD